MATGYAELEGAQFDTQTTAPGYGVVMGFQEPAQSRRPLTPVIRRAGTEIQDWLGSSTFKTLKSQCQFPTPQHPPSLPSSEVSERPENLGAMQASAVTPMKQLASFVARLAPAMESHMHVQHESLTPDEPTPFTWSECHNLAIPDTAGLPVRKPVVWPAVRLQVQLQLPLLYWAERHSWMWHKKWTLPKLHMRVTCDGKPVGGVALPGGEPPVYVLVSAGTIPEGGDGTTGGYTTPNGVSMYDQGLGGECQRRLVSGKATVSSLLFQNTSFNCGTPAWSKIVSSLAVPEVGSRASSRRA